MLAPADTKLEFSSPFQHGQLIFVLHIFLHIITGTPTGPSMWVYLQFAVAPLALEEHEAQKHANNKAIAAIFKILVLNDIYFSPKKYATKISSKIDTFSSTLTSCCSKCMHH